MKAVRVHAFGDESVLSLEETPDLLPARGEVLVKIHAAGVNPVDTYIRSGIFPKKPELPFTPGLDAAGVVEAVGPDVRKFKEGDRVYLFGSLSGTYAEKALCLESHLFSLPENLSFEQGAAIGIPYATAYRALFHKAALKGGETVLINGGSGAVGLAAIQLARAAGATVIATAGTEEGQALVLAEGAHHALNHKEPGYLDGAMALTRGHGVNVILEMLANVNLGKDLEVLALRGRVVVIGSRGDVEINPRNLMGKDSTITGVLIFNTPENDLREIHAALYAGFENQTLRPVIAKSLLLLKASDAHREVLRGPALGKIVLIPIEV